MAWAPDSVPPVKAVSTEADDSPPVSAASDRATQCQWMETDNYGIQGEIRLQFSIFLHINIVPL